MENLKKEDLIFGEIPTTRNFKDITGCKFERLLVLGISRKDGIKWKWFCECDCGVIKTVTADVLKSGRTKSCGCLHKEVVSSMFVTHGLSGSNNTYRIWASMLQRCGNPKDKKFRHYGGRGIAVCERWKKFDNFLADMGERPFGMSIDRKDVDGDYCPENCRWATEKEQQNNRRNNHNLTHDGVTKTITEWSESCGVDRRTLLGRIRDGWPAEKAINTPTGMSDRTDAVMYEFNGESMTLKKWAEKFGVKKGFFKGRISSGKSIGDIIALCEKLFIHA